MTKRGFTLIELSIVLVILGLIVGAIVGGKSLIEAAKLQGILREMNGYTTAYNAFKLEYDAVPGDMPDAWDYFGGGIDDNQAPAPCGYNAIGASGCNGDGNGVLYLAENIAAWTHLQLAEIIQGKVGSFGTNFFHHYPSPGTSHSNSEQHYNVPQLKGGEEADGWLFASGHAQDENNWFGRSGNWLQLGAYTNSLFLDGGVISQKNAAAIDKKIDDGKPVKGNVTAISGSIAGGTDANVGVDPPCMTGGYYDVGVTYADRHTVTQTHPDLTYNLASNSKSCVLHFYLGN